MLEIIVYGDPSKLETIQPTGLESIAQAVEKLDGRKIVALNVNILSKRYGLPLFLFRAKAEERFHLNYYLPDCFLFDFQVEDGERELDFYTWQGVYYSLRETIEKDAA